MDVTWVEGTSVVKHWVPVWLWENHVVLLTRLEPCPVKGERISSLHSASGSEAVLTCRLLWVSPSFCFFLSFAEEVILGCQDHWLSVLFWGRLQQPGFSMYFISSRTLTSFKKRCDPEKYLRWKVLRMRWIGTNGRELLFYRGVPGRCQGRHSSSVLPCTLVAPWKLLLVENIVSFEGISYHLTGQVV